MEDFFSVLEDRTKPLFDAWISNPFKWSEDDKSLIAIFLSFMYTRAPRTIELTKEMGAVGINYRLDKLKDVANDAGKFKKLYEDFCASKEGKGCKISFKECSHLMSDPLKYVKVQINEKHAIGDSLRMSEAIYRVLMSMHWGIGYIDDEHFFVTNDTPVNIFVPTNDKKAILGSGFGSPKAEINFPLSPKLCLRIRHTPINRYHRVYAGFVDEINRRSVYTAERYIISSFKSNRIYKIVKEAASTYGKPKIDAEKIRQRLEDAGVGNNL